MASTRGTCTVQDYLRTPEDWRGELVEGALLMTPSPVPYHNYLVTRLVLRLCEHLGPEQAWRVLPAPTDVFLDDHNVFQPDVLVLPDGEGPTGPDWEIPLPLWVVEVLSPHTAARDRNLKLPRYARAGVREAWLIAPRKRTVQVHDLVTGKHRVFEAGDRAPSSVLPGFELDLDILFRTRN